MVSTIAKKRVVIIGGGMAGSVLAKSLQDHADVYLIDPKEYFEIAWASLRCMVEPAFAERTLINHSEYAPNAHIITSAATSITQTQVTTANGRVISYDYLFVIANRPYDDKSESPKRERIHHYKADQDKIKLQTQS
ncbi:hypothetical protein Leryth_013752 [Lithospermum erythrorhizon]|nr:hypothetical protein Leryth_013752 [Lithospermum erythrorhizon]